MASTEDFVDFVSGQVGLPGRVSSKKMFGEYALYLDGKVVALICDNQLFVKPTDEGRRILGTVIEAPPYPGAKPYFEVGEQLDDRDLLSRLLLATAAALPAPKAKPKPKPKPKATLKPKPKPSAKSAKRPRAKKAPKRKA